MCLLGLALWLPAQTIPNNNNGLPANNNQQGNISRPQNQPATPANSPGAPEEFRNMRTFTQDGVFQIPKGTKLIKVEVWGAGGGGSSTGGGGGGAFVRSVFTIIDGGEITVRIGQGGKGGTTMAQAGGTTSVQFKGALPLGNANMVSASGGEGAVYVQGANGYADEGFGGQQGTCSNYTIGYFMMPGEDGEVYTDTYSQSNNNTYVVTRNLGKGGDAGNTVNTGGRAEILLNPANPSYKRNGGAGKLPGGGGGGSTNPRGGFNGAPGMAIIYY